MTSLLRRLVVYIASLVAFAIIGSIVLGASVTGNWAALVALPIPAAILAGVWYLEKRVGQTQTA